MRCVNVLYVMLFRAVELSYALSSCIAAGQNAFTLNSQEMLTWDSIVLGIVEG